MGPSSTAAPTRSSTRRLFLPLKRCSLSFPLTLCSALLSFHFKAHKGFTFSAPVPLSSHHTVTPSRPAHTRRPRPAAPGHLHPLHNGSAHRSASRFLGRAAGDSSRDPIAAIPSRRIPHRPAPPAAPRPRCRPARRRPAAAAPPQARPGGPTKGGAGGRWERAAAAHSPEPGRRRPPSGTDERAAGRGRHTAPLQWRRRHPPRRRRQEPEGEAEPPRVATAREGRGAANGTTAPGSPQRRGGRRETRGAAPRRAGKRGAERRAPLGSAFLSHGAASPLAAANSPGSRSSPASERSALCHPLPRHVFFTASPRLEKTFEIVQSNHPPITNSSH